MLGGLAVVTCAIAVNLTWERVQGVTNSLAIGKLAQSKGIGSDDAERTASYETRLRDSKSGLYYISLMAIAALVVSCLGHWLMNGRRPLRVAWSSYAVGVGLVLFLFGVGTVVRSEMKHAEMASFVKNSDYYQSANSVSIVDTQSFQNFPATTRYWAGTTAVIGAALFIGGKITGKKRRPSRRF